MKFGNKLRRVDVQVSLLMIATSVFCTVCVYIVGYYLTYQDMIRALEDRVFAIHGFVEKNLDKATFRQIRNREDMAQEGYLEAKTLLESVKQATNVMYLYTAMKNEEGAFVYVVDGLDGDAEDFRYPGDLIEQEICGDMQRALDGETVLPEGIKNTDWGMIFITYFPIHDGEEVIGVLGIEFEAAHQYRTYQTLKVIVPIIILVTSLIAAVTAIQIFKRISNPTYQDMSNTDQLTKLKNRNAFETDLHNLDAGRNKTGIGIIEADLNNLKMVNDKLGHGAGDLYIQAAGRAIREAVPRGDVVYRMGGDEFTVILKDTGEEILRELSERIAENLEAEGVGIGGVPLSISVGCALYDPDVDQDLAGVYNRADADMYEKKKKYHSTM